MRLVMQQIRERSPILREMLDKGEISIWSAACMICPPARFNFLTHRCVPALR